MSEHSISINTRRENTLAVATGGICVAVAFVLSLITVYKMPQGGSVTPASMLPIFFFALCFGPAWGLGAAFLFSLLQLIGGYFMLPVQVLLDYTVAFTVLGIAGFFAAPKEKRLQKRSILGKLSLVSFDKMIISVVLGVTLRMFSHVLSGVIFFAEYAGEQNPWIYSIIYNGSYLLPELIITLMLLLAVRLSFRIGRPKK
ncbi:MAG: energy-coupled thiamine transporter ThiT [Oscillospiraceae bacterium]|nr:energy-coupled thiamine transporter ThiT [Oscillospiraceae bacterium]